MDTMVAKKKKKMMRFDMYKIIENREDLSADFRREKRTGRF